MFKRIMLMRVLSKLVGMKNATKKEKPKQTVAGKVV
jgi:hypothetical protein